MQAGGKFASVQLDVADRQQVNTLFDRVPAELKTVDVLGASCSPSSEAQGSCVV